MRRLQGEIAKAEERIAQLLRKYDFKVVFSEEEYQLVKSQYENNSSVDCVIFKLIED